MIEKLAEESRGEEKALGIERAHFGLKLVEEKAIQDAIERRVWADQEDIGVKELARNSQN